MKRFLIAAVAAASMAAALIPAAHATDVTSSFDVKVALTAICTAANSGTQVLDFGTYTAFGSATNSAPTVDLTFTCTRGLTPPTFSFDAAKGGANGVLAGLNYTLGAANGANQTTGTAATPGVAGTADVRKVTVTGGMVAGQPGTCAATAAGCSGAVTDTRVLTITY
jgi:opacity protein-like surface antigen